jgi:magnesium-transporting ATPase (P-type)
MTTPNEDSATRPLVDTGTAGSKIASPPASPNEPSIPKKTKNNNIHVSPAVLDAARKEGEELLRDLRTSLGGLTQAEAEERARTTGPNEVAQERKQGWPIRVLKIIRNPLVILLSTLSAISFLTGDARAGSVMVGMVAAGSSNIYLADEGTSTSATVTGFSLSSPLISASSFALALIRCRSWEKSNRLSRPGFSKRSALGFGD